MKALASNTGAQASTNSDSPSETQASARYVNFGTPFKDRLSHSFELWIPQLQETLADIAQNPASNLTPENRVTGVAVASGPSAVRNVQLLEGRGDVVVCCADRAAATYGHLLRNFYVGTSDPTSLVAEFYQVMPPPKAAVISIFTNSSVVNTLSERKIPHYYYTPALADHKDEELKLINKLLLELTKAPLMYGVADSGSLAWRILVGLGCKRIALVGYDMSEPYEAPFKKWSLHSTYKAFMKSHEISKEEMFKRMNVRDGIHSRFGSKFWTDSQWDHYRGQFYSLLRTGFEQNIKTFNATEGGSLDADWLPCLKLQDFLNEKT